MVKMPPSKLAGPSCLPTNFERVDATEMLPHLKMHCRAEINRSSPECRPLLAPPSFFIAGASWNFYLASFSLGLISWVEARIILDESEIKS